MWATIHACLLLAWILSSWKTTIACKNKFNKFLKQYNEYKLINKVSRMNVNIANPWTFGEAKSNKITSMFHMLPLTWIYHMKMQNKLRMVMKARWKSQKSPPFVPKGKQNNCDQAIEENGSPNCKLYTILLRF